jgi:hypothetical protein
MNKKAQIGNLPEIIITLVIVGIIVAIGLILFDKFGSAVKEDISITNTTFTNNTALGYEPVSSVSGVWCNGSVAVATGNYSFDGTKIIVYGTELRSCTSFTASWEGRDNTSAYDALASSTDAVSPITSDWLPIIVIVVVVGIIMSLIFLAFRSYGNKRQ